MSGSVFFFNRIFKLNLTSWCFVFLHSMLDSQPPIWDHTMDGKRSSGGEGGSGDPEVEDEFACAGMLRGSLTSLHSTVERIFRVTFGIGADDLPNGNNGQIWLKLQGLSTDVKAAKVRRFFLVFRCFVQWRPATWRVSFCWMFLLIVGKVSNNDANMELSFCNIAGSSWMSELRYWHVYPVKVKGQSKGTRSLQ